MTEQTAEIRGGDSAGASIKDKIVFGYRPGKTWPAPLLILYHIAMPYFLLSTIQSIVTGIAFIFYINTPEASGIRTLFASITSTAKAPPQDLYKLMMDELMKFMSSVPCLISMAIGYIATIACYYLIVRVFEKRPAATMGLPFGTAPERKKALLSYGTGLGIGLLMMSAVFFLLTLTGQSRVDRIGLEASFVPLFVLYILMWLPQGASEEIMTRGYMIPRLSARFGRAAAVAISSLYFGLLHSFNNGFSLPALVNLILFAVFAAFLALYAENIWTVCAVHSVWNFAQGNLFGFEVSGTATSSSVLLTKSADGASELLTGGSFGPEGGLFVTAVLLVGIGVLILLSRRKAAEAKAL